MLHVCSHAMSMWCFAAPRCGGVTVSALSAPAVSPIVAVARDTVPHAPTRALALAAALLPKHLARRPSKATQVPPELGKFTREVKCRGGWTTCQPARRAGGRGR
jgi:hypothetical protein